jgi:hypothetical protein
MADFNEVINAVKASHKYTRSGDGPNTIKGAKEALLAPLQQIVKNTGDTAAAITGLRADSADQAEQLRQQQLLAADQALVEGRAGSAGQPPGIKNGASQAAGGALAAIGGLLGGLGAGAMGLGLSVLGPGLVALSVGLAAFANPVTVVGGAALLTFLGGLGGVAYLAGLGAQEIGKGLDAIGDGIDRLDEVGKKVEMDNLVAAGKGLSTFLENVGSLKGIFGAVITFLTGDLVNIADGMNKLNTITVDKEKLIAAGEGLNAFMSAMGEGSFFGKLVGSISTAIAPDMEKLANGFSKLSDVSKTFDLAKFQDMSAGMAAIAAPLAAFGKSGIVANFVGDEALSDIASGITALNKTEVNRLSEVAAGMKSLDKDLFEVVKSAFAANFAGKNSLKDIGDGVSYLNKTEVDRLGVVAEGFKIIKDPLLSITGIGLAANFVGKGAMTDLTDAASDMNERLGSNDALTKAVIVSKVFKELSGGLKTWTGATFLESLSGVGKSILNFISGEESPITGILKLTDKASDLVSVSESLKKIGEALSSFSSIKINSGDVDFEGLAKKLGAAVPLMEGLAKGGKVNTSWLGSVDFGKGLLSPDLRLDEMSAAIQQVNNILGFQPQTQGAAVNVGSTTVAAGQRGGGSPTIVSAPTNNNQQTMNNNVVNQTNARTPSPRPNQFRGGTYAPQ